MMNCFWIAAFKSYPCLPFACSLSFGILTGRQSKQYNGHLPKLILRLCLLHCLHIKVNSVTSCTKIKNSRTQLDAATSIPDSGLITKKLFYLFAFSCFPSFIVPVASLSIIAWVVTLMTCSEIDEKP